MKTFARYFAITFAIAPGVLAAVLLMGAVAFGGYSLYRADQNRRAEEQAIARATATAQERATVITRQATEQATATALRVEGEQRQRAASATAEAVKLAARRCENPRKLVVQSSYDSNQYRVSGSVKNTCNYDIVFNMDLDGLATNRVSIVTPTYTVAISGEVAGGPGQGRSALIRAGTERTFSFDLGGIVPGRKREDIASVRVTPVIVREGDPP